MGGDDGEMLLGGSASPEELDLEDLDATLDVEALESGDLARLARKKRQEARGARHDGIVAKIAELKAARVQRMQEKIVVQRLHQENKQKRLARLKEAEKAKVKAAQAEEEELARKKAEEEAEAAKKKTNGKKKRSRSDSDASSRGRGRGKKINASATKKRKTDDDSSDSAESSSSDAVSSAPSEGAMAIAHALSLDSSLALLRTEQIEKALNQKVPDAGHDPFAVVVDTEDAVALGQIMVAHSTHKAMGALPPSVEVEQFLQLSQVDGEAAIKMRSLPYPCQKAIIDKGPIMGTRAPSSVLLARIRDVELGRTVAPTGPESSAMGSGAAEEGGGTALPGMMDTSGQSAMSRGYGCQPMDQTMRAVHMAFKKLF